MSQDSTQTTARQPDASTHDCPGCGQPGVPRHHFTHKPCWFRLPKHMRDEINATYKLRKAALTQAGRDDATRAWRQALRAATYWYRDNAEES